MFRSNVLLATMCLRREDSVPGLRAALGYSRIFLLVLMTSACARRPASVSNPDSVFRLATTLRQRGDLPQALALAERGLAQFEKRDNSQWFWKFRLLKAEVLLTQGKAADGSELLQEPLSALPDSPELKSRYLLDQGLAEYWLS